MSERNEIVSEAINGRSNGTTNGAASHRTYGRGSHRIDKRRSRRIIRNAIVFLMVVFIASVLYLESGHSAFSTIEAKPDYGSLKNETENIKIRKTDISKAVRTHINLSEIDLSNELMLVNSEKRIYEDFAAELSPAYRVVPLSTSDIQMNETVLEAVTDMFEAAKEKGFKDFFVNSGFRSYQKQKELYDSEEDKGYVQEPGASEHQTGYALDIAYNGLTGDAFDNSPQGKWLMENAHKYGFILRYPEDKTEITKISYEPWHYRYVGIPHAYYCYENDLCLEEYISFLAKGGSYSISIDKTNYTVYYATENDGFIDVPADKSCKVSSDNTGGYVVVVMG